MVLHEGHYRLDLEDFEEKIRRHRPSIFLLVSPHNPTGRLFTREELTQMVEICARYQVKIISDEVHFLLTYDGKKHLPILGVSEKAREISIQVFSYSKGFNLMGLPHAMILIANPDIRQAWERWIEAFDFDYASNAFSIAAVTAVAGGEADSWLEALTDYLQNHRDTFLRTVSERGWPLHPTKPEASFLFWIDCRPSGIAPEELDRVFLERPASASTTGWPMGKQAVDLFGSTLRSPKRP